LQLGNHTPEQTEDAVAPIGADHEGELGMLSAADRVCFAKGAWIAKVAVALGLVLMGWAMFGSSWYFDHKAQICSPTGRAFSTPDMSCYEPPRPG